MEQQQKHTQESVRGSNSKLEKLNRQTSGNLGCSRALQTVHLNQPVNSEMETSHTLNVCL